MLNEVSGVAASRTQPPLLWVHDDSGGAPAVYAIRPDGTLVATYTIDGATNTDWEDIAVGPGPERGTSYLYIGDIGQNGGARDQITVYRVAEPDTPVATTGTLTGADVISLRYPDQPVDAESMFVDPRTGDLFVIDKQYLSGVGHVFRAPKRALVDGADVTMREVASFTLAPDDSILPTGVARFPGTIITGADISPDGSTILVRTYRRVLAFSRGKHGTVAAAFRPAVVRRAADRRTPGRSDRIHRERCELRHDQRGSRSRGAPVRGAPAVAGLKCDWARMAGVRRREDLARVAPRTTTISLIVMTASRRPGVQ